MKEAATWTDGRTDTPWLDTKGASHSTYSGHPEWFDLGANDTSVTGKYSKSLYNNKQHSCRPDIVQA